MHTHLEQWAADCAAPGEQSWTSCRSRDSNPQPWVTSGFKSNALSIRPTTAHGEVFAYLFSTKREYLMTYFTLTHSITFSVKRLFCYVTLLAFLIIGLCNLRGPGPVCPALTTRGHHRLFSRTPLLTPHTCAPTHTNTAVAHPGGYLHSFPMPLWAGLLVVD